MIVKPPLQLFPSLVLEIPHSIRMNSPTSHTNSTDMPLSESTNSSSPFPKQKQTLTLSEAKLAELADLGIARAENDTAAISDRDFALTGRTHVAVQAGRAPKGLENEVFAWNAFKYTTEERDGREELKGDLHEGQLHRQNRAAQQLAKTMKGHEDIGRGKGPGTGGGGPKIHGVVTQQTTQVQALCAGRKPEGMTVPPLAKGMAEKLDKSMFWDEPIVPE